MPKATTLRACAGVVAALAVVVLGLLTLRGLEFAGDLHLWDEAFYLAGGRRVLREGFAALPEVWSPLYSTSLGVAERLVGSSRAPWAAGVVLATSSALLCFASLRAVAGTGAAVLASAWWSLSLPEHLTVGPSIKPMVYLMTATLLFAALWQFLRGRFLIAVAFYAIAGVDRPELAMAGIVIGALGAMARGLGREARFGWVGLLAVSGVLFLYGTATPILRERQWMAFAQHYALGVAEARRSADPSVFLAPEEIVREHFPGCSSLPAAVVENAGAVMTHVARNVAHLGQTILHCAIAPFARRTWLAAGFWLVVAALIVAGSRSGSGAGGRTAVLAAFAAGGCLTALSIRPRWELVLPVILPLITEAAVRARAGWLVAWRGTRASKALAVIGLTCVGTALLCGHRSFAPPDAPSVFARYVVRSVAQLPAGALLAAPGGEGLVVYSGRDDIRGVDLLGHEGQSAVRSGALAAWIERRGIDHLMVTPDMLEGMGPALAGTVHDGSWHITDIAPNAVTFAKAAVTPDRAAPDRAAPDWAAPDWAAPDWAAELPSLAAFRAGFRAAAVSTRRRWLATAGRVAASGSEITQEILRLTSDDAVADVALWAAVQCCGCGPGLRAAVESAARRDDARTRVAAAWALGYLEDAGQPSELLRSLQADDDGNVRMAATAALRRAAGRRR